MPGPGIPPILPGETRATIPGTNADPGTRGGFTRLDDETFYRISGYHRMPSFLMSIPSDSDIWLFVSSRGGLTAGRVDPDGSLFPYETVDKLHDGHHHTGPITLIRVEEAGRPGTLWEPFSDRAAEMYRTERNLYKNVTGNRLVFEEINRDLGLRFRYRWSACDAFGLVRTATLANFGDRPRALAVLDGLRNILPCGAPLVMYQQSSSLVDAYKRSDCDPGTGLGIFSLTSRILDRPEAAEELRANTVWSHGLPEATVSLSLNAVQVFREGVRPAAETTLTGCRGNYLISSAFTADAGESITWHTAADAGRSHLDIGTLRARLADPRDLDREVEDGLDEARDNLVRSVGSADGLQATNHREASAHHAANVLFNNMRGGVLADNYQVPTRDFIDFLRTWNRSQAARHTHALSLLPESIPLPDLIAMAAATGDPDFERLAREYLPITFGRRHGDPSRPWNRFSIRVRNADGSRALRYEGNWRDIFQNWEALCLSYPGVLPSVVAKFVNASTVDGFNPYRITRDGVDWEVPEPGNPWSHIGYWGDHQIVYLLKFLEAWVRHEPGALSAMLDRKIFCYAAVPYRIEAYAEILRDPRSTIVFDEVMAAAIQERVNTLGSDGKLVTGPDGSVVHVTLIEKLLVPALSKLSNLVPGGGIWMNTQRPEWNDANNALVGSGVSLVTLCYLRRYLAILEGLAGTGQTAVVSTEVAAWFRRLHSVFEENRELLDRPDLGDRDRKRILDALGEAFSEYRTAVYDNGFSGEASIPHDEIVAFSRIAMAYLDHTIRGNRRSDGLYHAYNLIEVGEGGEALSVRHLPEMLEGQVAVLSSGVLDPAEASDLVRSLFESRLFREDQQSFQLYPETRLPSFLEKNAVPEAAVDAVPLLRSLVNAGESSVVGRDAQGTYRFAADLRNSRDLASSLDRLAANERWTRDVARDREGVLEVFELVFHHRSFTGRSGTMYAYEGLGSIYWHMVAKLLLAVQEIILDPAGGDSVRSDLVGAYYRIRSGLGFEKTPAEYGAFPTDPYSHTPAGAGAQQPGMTGQVKEEILTRFGEFGVRVEDGRVGFRPVMLRASELLETPSAFSYYDLFGEAQVLELPARALVFTLCQVPVVYERIDGESWIRVTRPGSAMTREGNTLDAEESRSLFARTGVISRIEVGVPGAEWLEA